jgi:hypothetical protein
VTSSRVYRGDHAMIESWYLRAKVVIGRLLPVPWECVVGRINRPLPWAAFHDAKPSTVTQEQAGQVWACKECRRPRRQNNDVCTGRRASPDQRYGVMLSDSHLHAADINLVEEMSEAGFLLKTSELQERLGSQTVKPVLELAHAPHLALHRARGAFVIERFSRSPARDHECGPIKSS